MTLIRGAIEQTVSISHFNRGLAGKIFDDVKRSGAKVVMKNNAAECVLLSPQEFLSLINELNEARLYMLANERMAHYSAEQTISQQQIDNEFGFDSEDLSDSDEVEFE